LPSSTATSTDGLRDVQRAAEELAERLPSSLAPLARLAFNYRWSWLPGAPEMFRSIDPERFERSLQNPVRLLQEVSPRVLRRSPGLTEQAMVLEARLEKDLQRPPAGAIDASRPVAFLCAEYGVHVSLPVYAGGLGALAGDLLKEASDQALPLVAVGLMYRKGYFRQRIDAKGWQHEYWVDTDPQLLPAALVTGPDDRPLTITVPIYDATVTARIWRVNVGRIPLFLLDTDCPENDPVRRWITARLYDADPDTRLAQYVLLGIGGVRALRAMGCEPGLLHLNEGHAALAPFELGRPNLAIGEPLRRALASAREQTVFTTHTPVPAGNDSYPARQVQRAIAGYAAELGRPARELIALGRTHPEAAGKPFGVTQVALRLSRAANGVSRRHGDVARAMWQPLWPELASADVPISHVTNGVHIPTWLGTPMRELLDRRLGHDWSTRASRPETWAPVQQIPDDELWDARERQRAELVGFVRERSVLDRLARNDRSEYVSAAARAFDPQVLTLGFARRVATYKRLELLTRDPDRTLALLRGDRPVQVVLAGKAHPRDDDAKRSLRRLFGLKYARIIGERVVFLDDYDLATAAWLVRGCDVWLNLPRPPLEASGTSGMKSAVNGGLQLSVLDGWWAESYDGGNGWALPGAVEEDHRAQDDRDTAAFHRVLSKEVLPAFYERDERGLPPRWLGLMRASLRSIAPRFSAGRMLDEYVHARYRRP
jgi:starch phosphorylase